MNPDTGMTTSTVIGMAMTTAILQCVAADAAVTTTVTATDPTSPPMTGPADAAALGAAAAGVVFLDLATCA